LVKSFFVLIGFLYLFNEDKIQPGATTSRYPFLLILVNPFQKTKKSSKYLNLISGSHERQNHSHERQYHSHERQYRSHEQQSVWFILKALGS
jgi:hypothetical protein